MGAKFESKKLRAKLIYLFLTQSKLSLIFTETLYLQIKQPTLQITQQITHT